MIKFEIDSVHIDPEGLKIIEDYQALLNIGATLKIFQNGKMFFEEPCITIVELAQQLSKWLKYKNGDFVFETMDDEDQGILAFKRVDNEWLINSCWQEYEMNEPVEYNELCKCTSDFVSSVKLKVNNELGVNLEKLSGL